MEGNMSMSCHDMVRFPNMFEYIGEDVYNELVMTKAISEREIEDLYVERAYLLEYKWFPISNKPPKRKKYLKLYKIKQKKRRNSKIKFRKNKMEFIKKDCK